MVSREEVTTLELEVIPTYQWCYGSCIRIIWQRELVAVIRPKALDLIVEDRDELFAYTDGCILDNDNAFLDYIF